MFEAREITSGFLYFKLFLVILAIVSYLVAVKRTTPLWIKEVLGVEALVVILSIFNLALLFRQAGLWIAWDVSNLALGMLLYHKTRALGASVTKKGPSYFSILWSFSFWILGLLYLILFPIGLAPLK